MVKHAFSFMKQNPILAFGGGLIGFSIILLILAMSGLFSPLLILPLTAIFLISSLVSVFFFWKSTSGKEKIGLTAIALLVIGTVFLSHAEPSIFTGRDQGSISTAAIELAKNERLPFRIPVASDFFAIYGEGEALHFPGFFYTEDGSLITKFPLGYTAFLASFFQLFGLAGLAVGNGVLLFASLLTLFALLRKLAPMITWFGMIIFSTSLIPIFLVHLTLTENFALFLFLFLSLRLIEFFRDRSAANYFGMLLPAMFFPFVRVEGFAFLCIAILMTALAKETRRFVRENLLTRSVLPALFFIALLLANFFANNPFYHVIGKELFKSFISDSPAKAAVSFFAFPTILSLYGLLPILLAGCIGLAILCRSKKWNLLIPALLALPTFIYLLSPSVTPDHPWMLRRFLFSVWPALFLTFLFTLDLLLEKKRLGRIMACILPIFIILGQAPAFFSFVSSKNDTPLLPQAASFADRFSPADRILIDRETTGDGFMMISGPLASLLDTNAGYFFNPLDMKKLPFHEGQHTYLLVPEKKRSFYENNLPDFMLTPKETPEFALRSRETLPISANHFPRLVIRHQKNILLEVTRK